MFKTTFKTNDGKTRNKNKEENDLYHFYYLKIFSDIMTSMAVIGLFKNDKKKFFKELAFLLLSFFIPFVIILILLSVNGYSLFSYDGYTIMSYDMRSQYSSYMNYFRTLLIERGSFVYMGSKSLGGDFMSIYSYYLASPFNLFVVFFEAEAIPLFFVWSCVIKMCFASFNFYLLVRLTTRFNYYKLIPAIGYGLISYSFIYMTNFMWLDGMMIVPLAILGLYYIRDNKHLWLYPLALAYALLSSWYIGFMVVIFISLFFAALFFIDFRLKNKANYLFLLRFAIFSLVGGFIAAPLWFTAFMHFGGTKASAGLPKSMTVSISVLISGFLENNYDTSRQITQYNSYFSMFVGVVPLVFAITYFFNKKYTLRERLILLAVFVVYIVFSFNNALTALMHGGKEPTWFPGRYAFIMGFLMCFYASKGLDEADKLHPLYYIAPTALGITAIIILNTVSHSERLPYYPVSVASCIIYFLTIAIGTCYSTICYFDFKKQALVLLKKYSFIILSSLIVLQVASTYRGGDKVLRVNRTDKIVSEYSRYLQDTKYFPAFQTIKNYDAQNDKSAFYRMEATFNRPDNYNTINNSPMFYSYSGISHFSSSSNTEVSKFLMKLGFQYNSYFTKYDRASTYAINSLLGIKYLIEDPQGTDNVHPYFLDYDTFREIPLSDGHKQLKYYQNDNYINLGFVSDKTSNYYLSEGERISSTYTYWYDKFEFQNNMFKVGNKAINKDVYYPLTIKNIETNIKYSEDQKHVRTYTNIKNGDKITINFSVPEEAKNYPLYVSEREYVGDCEFIIDGVKYDINTYWRKGIASFPYNNKADHTLVITFTKNKARQIFRPELYYENIDITKEYLTTMKKQEFVVDNVSKSLSSYNFNGHINLQQKASKDLIFTIPFEDNIKVNIDGKNVETYKKYNIFTGVDLSNLEAGEHKVTISYVDRGLKIGLVVGSLACVSFIALIILYPVAEQKIFYRKRKEENISE